MSEPFLGEIRTFAFTFAPVGWALCNGQLLSIQQNEALFALLGTTYGGDGISTFALPNLQGRVPIHFGQQAGTSQYVQGQVGGAENVTLLTNQMPSHTHPVQCSSNGGNQAGPAGGYPAVESTGTSLNYSNAPNSLMNAAMNEPMGGNQPHANLQPFLVLNFCIALQGIFPSRN